MVNSTGEKTAEPLVSQWGARMAQMREWAKDGWTAAHSAERWARLRVFQMAVRTGCLRVLAKGIQKAG